MTKRISGWMDGWMHTWMDKFRPIDAPPDCFPSALDNNTLQQQPTKSQILILCRLNCIYSSWSTFPLSQRSHFYSPHLGVIDWSASSVFDSLLDGPATSWSQLESREITNYRKYIFFTFETMPNTHFSHACDQLISWACSIEVFCNIRFEFWKF